MIDTEVSTTFAVTGEFSPSEITSLLGIAPSKTYRRGDVIGNSTLTRQSDGWCLSVARAECLDANKQLKALLAKLRPKFSQLKNIIEHHKLYAEFSFAVYLREDSRPAIYLDKEDLSDIVQLNAEVDIDLYRIPAELD